LNLARVDDILAELRPQARRLAAQAEQQVTRASAGEELATALVVAAHGRWHEASTRHMAAADRLTRARAEADRATGELDRAEAAAATVSAVLGARADAERVRRETYEVARAAHTQLQLREARLASDLAAIGRDRERFHAERTTAETDLALRRRDAATPVPAPDADLQAGVAEAERGLAEALEEVGALRAVRQARGDELATVRRAEAARLAELETARRRLVEADRRAIEERADADRTAADRSGLEERRIAAARLASEAREAERYSIAYRELARDTADRADGGARAAAEVATAAGSRAAALRGRLDAIRARLAEDEARGIARAARRVGGKRLDEELQVEPAFRGAVEAALGEVARAYLVGRGAVAGLAAERGTVVVDEVGPGAPDGPAAAFAERLESLGGGILADAIRRDPLGPARRVLGRVAWVPDLAGLLELQPLLPPGWSAVTRDGGALAGPIAIALGRAEGPLERRAELDRLEGELATAQAEASERGRASGEADAAAGTARLALDVARASEAEAAATRRAADEAERAAGRAAENAAREAAWQVSQAERAEGEATRLREAVASLEAAAAGRSAGLEAVMAGQEDRSALAVWEARAGDLRARRDRVAVQLASAEAVRRDLEAGVARALAAAAYDEQRIARAEADERALAERETAALAEREQVAVELAAAAARAAAALAVLDDLRSAEVADREQLRAAEATATGARERLRAADDRVRSAEVAEVEGRLGLDAIREQVLVELAGIGPVGVRALRAAAVDLPEAAGDPIAIGERTGDPVATGDRAGDRAEDAPGGPEADVESAELEAILPYVVPAWDAARPAGDPPTPGRLAALRRRFHELGAANPFAVEEYAELRTRVDSLESQGSDLRAAIARTRTLIDELSTLIADQFRATFRALESAFDARFQQLFGGGFARLELTDPGDLASTGVEIVARPPGKKAQALAMLSGGERALTAVALLFAMLEVRPVPFCVLDEVDAALDEANVGRFSEALRSLAAATQFIVITHNRGTIEAADALYGVTVGDDSVSRVISLRLDEATAIAATAAGNGAGALDPVGS
ncbi:MAG: hypothetical protein ACXWW6_02860, partial [Candidatus Limnocylindrales bacterium]